MLRLLPFLLCFLLVDAAYAQGGDIDDALKVLDPGDRRTMKTDFLSEKGGSDFDPEGELDSVGSFRVNKQLEEVKKAQKSHDTRMASKCHCVFNVCLDAVPRDDTRTEAEIAADIKRSERARRQRESLCWRWYCSGGANSASYGFATEDRCPGGKIQSGGSGSKYYHQLLTLESELKRERATEARLRRQRAEDERTEREAKRNAQIAEEEARRERLRQRAAAERQEREARKLSWCQERWSRGGNPCGCAGLPGAPPPCIGPACTCQK